MSNEYKEVILSKSLSEYCRNATNQEEIHLLELNLKL